MLLRMISCVGAAAGFLAGVLFAVEGTGFVDSAFGFAALGLALAASFGIAKFSSWSELAELAWLALLGWLVGVSRAGIPDATSTDVVISGLGSLGAGALAGCLGSFGHPERPWHRSQILQSEAVVSPKYKRMVFCRHAFVRA
jgi:hypothetical protein